jgi:DNA-binding MurR/RpiR family transcriptional regulator
LPTLPAQLQDVRRYVAASDFAATTRTIRELAAAAGADPAAFTRLAQVLGYSDCDELRGALIETRRPPTPFSEWLTARAGPRRRQRHGGHAVVAFGFAPYGRASIATARAAHAGCRLVAVADTPAAPMVERADDLLLFAAAFSSLSGAVAIAQCLAAIFALGAEGASRTRKRGLPPPLGTSRTRAHRHEHTRFRTGFASFGCTRRRKPGAAP